MKVRLLKRPCILASCTKPIPSRNPRRRLQEPKLLKLLRHHRRQVHKQPNQERLQLQQLQLMRFYELVSCDETSLQALQASGLVGESLDLSLLATPRNKGEQGKSWVIPDPWTLSCHKNFPQKPKNRHLASRHLSVSQALAHPKLPLTLSLPSGYPSKGAH
ncbi:unannotated protein [freshwater metagenome]|uniref:Unannotated protein n=1 Tax=freshwater metagenome TaxID=449393 RepID=A0A6J7D4D1_9ZZZZ